ncbi:unnamed protein product, partial [Effrenium voratum]
AVHDHIEDLEDWTAYWNQRADTAAGKHMLCDLPIFGGFGGCIVPTIWTAALQSTVFVRYIWMSLRS